jgi:hypothetical protein
MKTLTLNNTISTSKIKVHVKISKTSCERVNPFISLLENRNLGVGYGESNGLKKYRSN